MTFFNLDRHIVLASDDLHRNSRFVILLHSSDRTSNELKLELGNNLFYTTEPDYLNMYIVLK